MKNKIDILFFNRKFVPAAAYNKKLTLFVVENPQVTERHGYYYEKRCF